MNPTTRFAELVMSATPPLDHLAEAIAQHRRPSLVTGSISTRLDELADGFHGADATSLLHYLTRDVGLRGNVADYYDDRNSMLDHVLERRLGIPITLSVVMIEVGRRADVPLVGIAMPGEFFVRERDRVDRYLNPFRGLEFDTAGAEQLFRAQHGAGVPFSPGLLAPVGPLEIVGRMLANLMAIYAQRSDHRSLTWVLRLRATLPGAGAVELGQLAGVLEATGHFWEAAETIERLAELQPEQANAHRHAVNRLRSLLN